MSSNNCKNPKSLIVVSTLSKFASGSVTYCIHCRIRSCALVHRLVLQHLASYHWVCNENYLQGEGTNSDACLILRMRAIAKRDMYARYVCNLRVYPKNAVYRHHHTFGTTSWLCDGTGCPTSLKGSQAQRSAVLGLQVALVSAKVAGSANTLDRCAKSPSWKRPSLTPQ